jgi:hypothetical protein
MPCTNAISALEELLFKGLFVASSSLKEPKFKGSFSVQQLFKRAKV